MNSKPRFLIPSDPDSDADTGLIPNTYTVSAIDHVTAFTVRCLDYYPTPSALPTHSALFGSTSVSLADINPNPSGTTTLTFGDVERPDSSLMLPPGTHQASLPLVAAARMPGARFEFTVTCNDLDTTQSLTPASAIYRYRVFATPSCPDLPLIWVVSDLVPTQQVVLSDYCVDFSGTGDTLTYSVERASTDDTDPDATETANIEEPALSGPLISILNLTMLDTEPPLGQPDAPGSSLVIVTVVDSEGGVSTVELTVIVTAAPVLSSTLTPGDLTATLVAPVSSGVVTNIEFELDTLAVCSVTGPDTHPVYSAVDDLGETGVQVTWEAEDGTTSPSGFEDWVSFVSTFGSSLLRVEVPGGTRGHGTLRLSGLRCSNGAGAAGVGGDLLVLSQLPTFAVYFVDQDRAALSYTDLSPLLTPLDPSTTTTLSTTLDLGIYCSLAAAFPGGGVALTALNVIQSSPSDPIPPSSLQVTVPKPITFPYRVQVSYGSDTTPPGFYNLEWACTHFAFGISSPTGSDAIAQLSLPFGTPPTVATAASTASTMRYQGDTSTMGLSLNLVCEDLDSADAESLTPVVLGARVVPALAAGTAGARTVWIPASAVGTLSTPGAPSGGTNPTQRREATLTMDPSVVPSDTFYGDIILEFRCQSMDSTVGVVQESATATITVYVHSQPEVGLMATSQSAPGVEVATLHYHAGLSRAFTWAPTCTQAYQGMSTQTPRLTLVDRPNSGTLAFLGASPTDSLNVDTLPVTLTSGTTYDLEFLDSLTPGAEAAEQLGVACTDPDLATNQVLTSRYVVYNAQPTVTWAPAGSSTFAHLPATFGVVEAEKYGLVEFTLRCADAFPADLDTPIFSEPTLSLTTGSASIADTLGYRVTLDSGVVVQPGGGSSSTPYTVDFPITVELLPPATGGSDSRPDLHLGFTCTDALGYSSSEAVVTVQSERPIVASQPTVFVVELSGQFSFSASDLADRCPAGTTFVAEQTLDPTTSADLALVPLSSDMTMYQFSSSDTAGNTTWRFACAVDADMDSNLIGTVSVSSLSPPSPVFGLVSSVTFRAGELPLAALIRPNTFTYLFPGAELVAEGSPPPKIFLYTGSNGGSYDPSTHAILVSTSGDDPNGGGTSVGGLTWARPLVAGTGAEDPDGSTLTRICYDMSTTTFDYSSSTCTGPFSDVWVATTATDPVASVGWQEAIVTYSSDLSSYVGAAVPDGSARLLLTLDTAALTADSSLIFVFSGFNGGLFDPTTHRIVVAPAANNPNADADLQQHGTWVNLYADSSGSNAKTTFAAIRYNTGTTTFTFDGTGTHLVWALPSSTGRWGNVLTGNPGDPTPSFGGATGVLVWDAHYPGPELLCQFFDGPRALPSVPPSLQYVLASTAGNTASLDTIRGRFSIDAYNATLTILRPPAVTALASETYALAWTCGHPDIEQSATVSGAAGLTVRFSDAPTPDSPVPAPRAVQFGASMPYMSVLGCHDADTSSLLYSLVGIVPSAATMPSVLVSSLDSSSGTIGLVLPPSDSVAAFEGESYTVTLQCVDVAGLSQTDTQVSQILVVDSLPPAVPGSSASVVEFGPAVDSASPASSSLTTDVTCTDQPGLDDPMFEFVATSHSLSVASPFAASVGGSDLAAFVSVTSTTSSSSSTSLTTTITVTPQDTTTNTALAMNQQWLEGRLVVAWRCRDTGLDADAATSPVQETVFLFSEAPVWSSGLPSIIEIVGSPGTSTGLSTSLQLDDYCTSFSISEDSDATFTASFTTDPQSVGTLAISATNILTFTQTGSNRGEATVELTCTDGYSARTPTSTVITLKVGEAPSVVLESTENLDTSVPGGVFFTPSFRLADNGAGTVTNHLQCIPGADQPALTAEAYAVTVERLTTRSLNGQAFPVVSGFYTISESFVTTSNPQPYLTVEMTFPTTDGVWRVSWTCTDTLGFTATGSFTVLAPSSTETAFDASYPASGRTTSNGGTSSLPFLVPGPPAITTTVELENLCPYFASSTAPVTRNAELFYLCTTITPTDLGSCAPPAASAVSAVATPVVGGGSGSGTNVDVTLTDVDANMGQLTISVPDTAVSGAYQIGWYCIESAGSSQPASFSLYSFRVGQAPTVTSTDQQINSPTDFESGSSNLAGGYYNQLGSGALSCACPLNDCTDTSLTLSLVSAFRVSAAGQFHNLTVGDAFASGTSSEAVVFGTPVLGDDGTTATLEAPVLLRVDTDNTDLSDSGVALPRNFVGMVSVTWLCMSSGSVSEASTVRIIINALPTAPDRVLTATLAADGTPTTRPWAPSCTDTYPAPDALSEIIVGFGATTNFGLLTLDTAESTSVVFGFAQLYASYDSDGDPVQFTVGVPSTTTPGTYTLTFRCYDRGAFSGLFTEGTLEVVVLAVPDTDPPTAAEDALLRIPSSDPATSLGREFYGYFENTLPDSPPSFSLDGSCVDSAKPFIVILRA